jgi:CRP-like cAMP-binding protein
MFIIKSGRVEVSCRGVDGRHQFIGQRGSEESCGETSCLLHKPRATTVTCISDEGCEALCVSRDEFLELVRGSWDVRQSLIAISERHKREKQRRMSFRRTQEEVYGEDDYFSDGEQESDYFISTRRSSEDAGPPAPQAGKVNAGVS